MGDFEDIFGAGADIDAIIDGICADEDRRDVNDDPVEHLLWFPDYAAAEAWEKAHRGVPFTRRRLQGGFEVRLRDPRSAAEKWRRSSMRPDAADRDDAPAPITLVRAEGLEDLVIRHGDFSVRLAKETTSLLVEFLARLRDEVPPGRAALSPVVIPTKQFNSFFRSMPQSLSHELEMGMGVNAVFCEDHHLLIGRRVGKNEIQIWPWILEMDCGGGKGGPYEGDDCFLCCHHETQTTMKNIPSNTHYDYEAFNYPASESHRHFINRRFYAGDARPTDLARCVTDWIARLAPFDAQMGPTRRAPSSVIAVRREVGTGWAALKCLCDVLACAIAMQHKIDGEVRVAVCATTDFESLTQATPEEIRLAWKKSPNIEVHLGASRRKLSTIPDIAGLDVEIVLPEWRDLVDLYPTERPPRSVIRSGGNTVAQGSFSVVGLTAQQKVEAMQVLSTLLERDLPPFVREFIESPAKV